QLRLGHLFERAEREQAGLEILAQGLQTRVLLRDLLSGKAQRQFGLIFELPAVFQDFFQFEMKGARHGSAKARSVRKKSPAMGPGVQDCGDETPSRPPQDGD